MPIRSRHARLAPALILPSMALVGACTPATVMPPPTPTPCGGLVPASLRVVEGGRVSIGRSGELTETTAHGERRRVDPERRRDHVDRALRCRPTRSAGHVCLGQREPLARGRAAALGERLGLGRRRSERCAWRTRVLRVVARRRRARALPLRWLRVRAATVHAYDHALPLRSRDQRVVVGGRRGRCARARRTGRHR